MKLTESLIEQSTVAAWSLGCHLRKLWSPFCITLLAFLAAYQTAAPARAAEVVHFPSAALGSTEEAPLWGHLLQPTGEGPFPAVVLLHGCGGIVGNQMRWASWLQERGFVALVLDSYRPRSILRTCSSPRRSAGPEARALDAHGALAYLQDLPIVDPQQIAVIGWSEGAIAALGATAVAGLREKLTTRFDAVVAFYPYCISERTYDLPVLILMGEADTWTPPAPCRALEARNRDHGSVEVVTYPGAGHAFDEPDLGDGFVIEGADGQGHLLKYDPPAHAAAEKRLAAFLKRYMDDE